MDENGIITTNQDIISVEQLEFDGAIVLHDFINEKEENEIF